MTEEIKLRPHHVANFAVYMMVDGHIDRTAKEYGPEFANFAKGVYDKLIANPQLTVRITRDLDDICTGTTCPAKTATCAPYRGKLFNPTDVQAAKGYGFHDGQTLTAGELVTTILEYSKKSVLLTPMDLRSTHSDP